MKILSENRKNVIECTCGCLYHYDDSDLKQILGTNYLLVECPKCTQQTILVMDTTNLKEADKVIEVKSEDTKESE